MHLHNIVIPRRFRELCPRLIIVFSATIPFFFLHGSTRGGFIQGKQKSLHYCLSGAGGWGRKSVSSGSGSSESDCNNKLCGIGLPPAFTANCLHQNEKRPRLLRILDDLPRAEPEEG